MTENAGGKIVAFERPASYWLSKARAIKAPSRLPDAARMYRKALEKSGDPDVALELARVYLDMQCLAAAEVTLLRAVARQGLTPRACLLIGRCALAMGDEALSERALEQCMHLSPGSVDADEAQDMLWSYPWGDENIPRFSARLRVMCLQGEDAQTPELADKRYKRASKLADTVEKTVYLAQMLVTAQLPRDLSFRLPREKLNHFALLLLRLQTVIAAGQTALAEETLATMASSCELFAEAHAFCYVAKACNLIDSAVSLCEERLSKAPYSADYMRLLAMCLLARGDKDRAITIFDKARSLDQLTTDSTLAARDALEDALFAVPPRLKKSPLNRLLHFLALTLQDDLTDETIYAIAAPAWRALNDRAKRRCEDQKDIDWYAAFVVYTLSAAGKKSRADDVLSKTKRKRHVKRLIARLNRLRRPLMQIH